MIWISSGVSRKTTILSVLTGSAVLLECILFRFIGPCIMDTSIFVVCEYASDGAITVSQFFGSYKTVKQPSTFLIFMTLIIVNTLI